MAPIDWCGWYRGGMSAVYLAERVDGRFDKRVAVKVMAPHLAGEDFLRRFQTEGQFLASLEHPNIPALLDGGVSSQGLTYWWNMRKARRWSATRMTASSE